MNAVIHQNRLVKSINEIALMEKAGKIVADTLTLLGKYMQAGIETIEIDKIAEDYIRSQGAKPAFKGFIADNGIPPFPGTLCISIDEVVVHGIPSKRKLVEGQIVSLDCGCEKDGYFGDSAVTYAVGTITEEKKKLLKITEESLYLGIEQATNKNKLYDVARAIQTFVEQNGYSVTRELVGHGIGKHLHEDPPVPNFVPPLLSRKNYPNLKLENGMAIAIEPMVQMGKKEVVTAKDGWTVTTIDNLPAAHFEHTVIINDGKALITTRRD